MLNVLAMGGRIMLLRDDDGKTIEIECFTREGWLMTDCTFEMFKSLRSKRAIASRGSGPYQISRMGLEALRGI